MIEQLIERIIREEIQKLLGTIATPAAGPASPPPADESDPSGPLFLSPKESQIMEYLQAKGAAKQAAIIKHFEDSINGTTCRECLGNLVHRRIVTRGPDGYAPARFPVR